MLQCQYCASRNVRWFTPRRDVERVAVLLCMGCHRLTIVPARSAREVMWTPSERAA
jgi:hypothetical protein